MAQTNNGLICEMFPRADLETDSKKEDVNDVEVWQWTTVAAFCCGAVVVSASSYIDIWLILGSHMGT